MLRVEYLAPYRKQDKDTIQHQLELHCLIVRLFELKCCIHLTIDVATSQLYYHYELILKPDFHMINFLAIKLELFHLLAHFCLDENAMNLNFFSTKPVHLCPGVIQGEGVGGFNASWS